MLTKLLRINTPKNTTSNIKSMTCLLRDLVYTRLITIMAVTVICGGVPYVQADYFNPALLELEAPSKGITDLSVFYKKGGQIPGTYRVDVFLNNKPIGTRDVNFIKSKEEEGVLNPCISARDLADWGVNINHPPKANEPCEFLSLIPHYSSEFLFEKQQLLLSLPQTSIKSQARGKVDPKLWDNGVNAFLLNYSIHGENNKTKEPASVNNNLFVSLSPGLNIGAWHLRNNTTWMYNSKDKTNSKKNGEWGSVYTYIQRGIPAINSNVTLGDTMTESNIFDSIPIRGLSLYSDEEMLPDSVKGFSPVVRGIAKTNAQITIRQNGYVIYQDYVSPGSFEINDLYQTGGGDFLVTIKEADGEEKNIVIPYSFLPVLQREGQLKYNISSGVYRPYDAHVEKVFLTQATASYGLKNGFTAYGGGQLNDNYNSLSFGLGQSIFSFGAVSVDGTVAIANRKNETRAQGQLWRIRYSKDFINTGTNIAISNFTYSNNFWNITDVLDSYTSSDNVTMQGSRRKRVELTLSQNLLEGWGALYITAVREKYRGAFDSVESYSFGYNNSYNGINLGLNYIYNRNSNHAGIYDIKSKSDQQLVMNISIPLNKFFDGHPAHIDYSLNKNRNGGINHIAKVGGTMLEMDNLTWGVEKGENTSGVNVDWLSTNGKFSGGYTTDQYNQRFNYGLQGGLIAHDSGITFGQQFGETVALVIAPGAKGIALDNKSVVKTNSSGHAIVPNVAPYRRNTLTLNTENLGKNTDIVLTTQNVVPVRGAVVRANYIVSVGHRVLMTLKTPDNKMVPFGAIVEVDHDSGATIKKEFIVGDNGQVYLTGLRDEGALRVRWGEQSHEQCYVKYSIPKSKYNVIQMTSFCK